MIKNILLDYHLYYNWNNISNNISYSSTNCGLLDILKIMFCREAF